MPSVAALTEVAMKRLSLALALLVSALPALAADWPQWLGPNRNGTSPETGLLTTWPAAGPKGLWNVPGGDGYSSVAVADGRAYTLVQRDGVELVLALDAATGNEKWKKQIGPAYKNQYGNGPRSTPAIDGGLVYVQSVSGPFVCLKAENGDVVWQHDLLKDYGAKNLPWGLSASPLIEGNLVLAVAGAGVVAFDKKSGTRAWKLGDDKAAYASPVAVTVGGQRQLVFFTAAGLVAATPEGKELWRVPWKTEYDCNIATPLLIGDQLFVSSGEEVGCALFKLSPGGPPEIAWESRGPKSVMINYWATSVEHDGYLYGLAGEFSKKIHLNCVEVKSGKLKWSKQDFGKAAITLADGHLFITTKAGDLVLARANPEKYEEKARVRILGENRTVPTIAQKRLYLRDREKIMCLDIAGK
jgi:outer membrane protein assembly factor BamB